MKNPRLSSLLFLAATSLGSGSALIRGSNNDRKPKNPSTEPLNTPAATRSASSTGLKARQLQSCSEDDTFFVILSCENVCGVNGLEFKAERFSGVSYLQDAWLDLLPWALANGSFSMDQASNIIAAGLHGWPFEEWCVTRVDDFSSVFRDLFYSFNVPFDYSSWDVSNATSFEGLFQGLETFNQNLCSWGLLDYQQGIPSTKDMFVGTACPTTEDPDFNAVPAGPFCHPCA
ncbi:Mycoplasma protein of unknown function, DUF285 [Seminavis robusta]|uniref:Uncharacterized protein n=1 Tax=Seminavis robusta TaxID=568900 RepID=A0A9N8HXJ3_9STRA|nr:Mycoplasma protein of unknown function, DUF285 [Seminavis robusta]|eukprot:Sro2228_g319900.1 Mycoplasma protein of unknown function, DUF285 (231) ;mRNA; r:13258-14127